MMSRPKVVKCVEGASSSRKEVRGVRQYSNPESNRGYEQGVSSNNKAVMLTTDY